MQEMWVQFLGREDLLEKEMAAHPSILAWRIPWIEASGRLQSMGLQSWTRLATKQQQASEVALVVKKSPANPGDIRDSGSISGSRRSPGGAHGNPLQSSCLGNSVERGAWRATVHRVTKSQT